MENELARFKLRFDTDDNEVDAATYARILLTTSVLVEESANELETGAKIALRVAAEKKGSFKPELVMWTAGFIGTTAQNISLEQLIAAKNFASQVIRMVTSCWNLKKWLKADSPKAVNVKGDDAVIVNGDNAHFRIDRRTYNVFVQERTQESLRDGSEALIEDLHVKEFEFLDAGDRQLFEARREEFPALAAKVPLEKARRRKTRRRAVLSVIRQSFERSRKSDFLYAGRSISAYIESPRFWDTIDQGERFAKGDKLVTTLEIDEEYDKTVKAWAHKAYKVVDVLEHRPREGQPTLFPKMA